jgi:hypothetical protein
MEVLGATMPYWAEERDRETLALVRRQVSEAAVEALDAGRALTPDGAVALALGSAAEASP